MIGTARKGNIVNVLAASATLSAAILAQLGEVDEALRGVCGKVNAYSERRWREESSFIVHGIVLCSVVHVCCSTVLTRRRRSANERWHRVGLNPDTPLMHYSSSGILPPARSGWSPGLARRTIVRPSALPSRAASPLVAHCHLGLGKLYRHTDKREQAGSI
jgi:hypothetical protein